MRISRALVTVLAASAGIALAPNAVAQNFAGATWVIVTRNQAPVTDTAGGAAHVDVVGAAATPAAFVASDASHLYFRIRLSGAPNNGAALQAATWGCMIDTDGATATYEYLAAVDGTVTSAQAVTWRGNAGGANSPSEVAETLLQGSMSIATFAQWTTSAPFFMDFAIPWSTIRGGASPIAAGKSMRFVCGTSTTQGNLATDTFDPGGTLSATFSDPFICNDAGCALDRDGDGVSDTLEGSLGTDPTKADSDADGLPDNVELSSSGSAGPYAKVDSDGDGTIDALDVDSDNDCRVDLQETSSSFRNKGAPNANVSSNCSGAKPVCDDDLGTCLACTGSFGAGGAAPCAFAALPVCNPSGALAGQCTKCSAAETSLCSGGTPTCNVDTGNCAACNGDFGAPSSSVCPSAAVPVCQTTGALLGRCTACSPTNVSQCTDPAKPACDLSNGTCQACNGDRGSGATRACATTAAPWCSAGTCGTCTSNTDCGSGHTGPTCNVGTGECTDVDTDGDGLNDTVEGLLGTDKNKPDSDNDGINDKIEVTPPGGGPSLKVDTDQDGTIDALDTDSDGDGALDMVEGSADLDGDGAPSFRDKDDDGDGIDTSVEIAEAATANLDDDVDDDGKKNYLDDDADGDGASDVSEGRGDDDFDGIPNYLDAKVTVTPVDGGPPAQEDSGISSSSSSSGGPPRDSGAVDPDAGDVDAGFVGETEGVVEGNGLLCSTTPGASSNLALVVMGAIAAVFARRRSKR